MTAWTAATASNGVVVPDKDQYIYGLMCWGQNPAVGGPSCDFERQALANLDWLVCVDLWETETATFWKRPSAIPGTGSIGTEVFLLPAAASYEKEGCITNSGRWSQWRWKALEPPGDALDDLEIINRLAKKLIYSYQSTATGDSYLDNPVANLYWGPYPGTDAHGINCKPVAPIVSPLGNGLGYETGGHADPNKVEWEINGYFCPTVSGGSGATAGTRVNGYYNATASAGTLQENGGTSCGNWIYCSHYINPVGGPGSFEAGVTDGNRMAKRTNTETGRADGKYIGLYKNWAYAWPSNRRIIYNGAAVYQTSHPSVGQPLAPNKWVIAYDSSGTAERAGGDVADGYTAPGGTAPRYPFIMIREGHAHLFTAGVNAQDGPFPEHYEPWETVMTGHPLETVAGESPHVLASPTLFAHARPEAYEHPGNGNADFPIIGTTYRVTEHWQAGQMTRNNPWLCELMPNAFVELSEELATILGIVNGDQVEMKTQRTDLYGTTYTAAACVTKRLKPYSIEVDGSMKTVHLIGTVWHFGYNGLCTGDSANLLTPHVGDANTGIPESKQFICNLRKVGNSWPTL